MIRTAARMAEAFHSGFTALFVQTPDTKELSGRQPAPPAGEPAPGRADGGADCHSIWDDPAVQIAEYARVSGVTKIVMGRVNHRQGLFFTGGKGALADRLISLTGNLDVYIIPDQQPLYKKRHRRILQKEDLSFSWKDSAKTLLLLALATVLGFAFSAMRGSVNANIITDLYSRRAHHRSVDHTAIYTAR